MIGREKPTLCCSPLDTVMNFYFQAGLYLRKNKKHRKQRLGDGHDIQPYDETLIAVIGVLDEVKVQTNVAAWIRAGGLWVSPTSTPELDQPNEGQRDTSPSLLPDTVLPEDGDTTDGSDLSVDGTRTRSMVEDV